MEFLTRRKQGKIEKDSLTFVSCFDDSTCKSLIEESIFPWVPRRRSQPGLPDYFEIKSLAKTHKSKVAGLRARIHQIGDWSTLGNPEQLSFGMTES